MSNATQTTPADKRKALNLLCAHWKHSGHLGPDVYRPIAQAAILMIAENLWLRDQVPNSTYRMLSNDAHGRPLAHGI